LSLRTLMTTPAGSVSYTYDQAGRLDTVVDADRRTFACRRRQRWPRRTLARPNGVTTIWGPITTPAV
jgi:YD repeat-containing protein